jgi:hypothetical protein
MEIFDAQLSTLTIPKMKAFLKSINATNSFRTKSDYIERMETFKKVIDFPWRKDQRTVLDNFLFFHHKYYCINAIFGAGKTTLLMGMLINGIIKALIKPDEVLFLSYNISIKNEIKRKLKDYGISSKVTVRTFDSVIYEICKNTGYKYIDLPNFEGKRKHAIELTYNNCDFTLTYRPKIIFIDECQDLEKNTLDVLNYFYPNSKFVFTGDIFQSIQKEPRESILWYLINNDVKDCYKMYMSETPRVPQKILSSLKDALSTYYPEFKTQIMNWTSANTISDCDIEWRTLNSYSHIFQELSEFCDEHQAEESMILTFSSSITVRGQMGDVSRIRRFLLSEGLNINTNHKRQEPENYFLTTANSSKGLERDYVICFLTFPLEKAFINLSDDVVVNLITVALTRAKKKVIFYVPKYQDKYSRVLELFKACPKPTQVIRKEDKGLNEYKFQNYLDMEVSVTQLLRQSIIKYDTRIKLTENYAKPFKYEKIFEDGTFDFKKVPKILLDEERQFVGVFIENLITSTWTGQFPGLGEDVSNIENNPMYAHCITKIKKLLNSYKRYCNKPVSDVLQFDGVYMYSQVHLALSDKIFMNLSETTIKNLKTYWNYFKPKCYGMKPQAENMKIQARLKMPWITGVADVITNFNEEEKNNNQETTIYEIKASIDIDWAKDALIQAVLYSLMTGKTWTKIILINPFKNEKIHYCFDTYLKTKNENQIIDKKEAQKNILYLRDLVINDVLVYNMNCMMAKMKRVNKNSDKVLNITDNLFLNVNDNGVSLIKMHSPIKCELLYHKYYGLENNQVYDKNSKEKYSLKRRNESKLNKEQILQEIKNICLSKINSDKKIYSNEKIDGLKTVICKGDVTAYYKKDKEKSYGLNMQDSLHTNLITMGVLYSKFSFQ